MVPVLNFHGPMLVELLVHFECLPEPIVDEPCQSTSKNIQNCMNDKSLLTSVVRDPNPSSGTHTLHGRSNPVGLVDSRGVHT